MALTVRYYATVTVTALVDKQARRLLHATALHATLNTKITANKVMVSNKII